MKYIKVIDYDNFAFNYGRFRDRIPALIAAEFLKCKTINSEHECIFDIGANYGKFFQQSRFYDKFTQYLFEPNVDLIPKQAEAHVNWINVAVSDQEGVQSFHASKYHSGGGKLVPSVAVLDQKVRTVRLDEYVCSDFNVGNIVLIKIDTEGHEGKVIVGMQEIVRKYTPIIVVENNDNLIEHVNFLQGYYDVFAIEIKGLDYDRNISRRLVNLFSQLVSPCVDLTPDPDLNIRSDNLIMLPKDVTSQVVIGLAI